MNRRFDDETCRAAMLIVWITAIAIAACGFGFGFAFAMLIA